MKNLLKLLPFLVISIILKSCTAESRELEANEEFTTNAELMSPDQFQNMNCTGELPRTRLINNGTIDVNLQVVREDGLAEITIPNISPGTTTNWNDFNVGEVLFSVTNDVPMVNDEKVVLDMDTCMGYEIEIGPDNQIVSFVPIIF